MVMQFHKTANTILEAIRDDNRKGTRTYDAQRSTGPAGITNSSIPTGRYGQYDPQIDKNKIVDTKATSVRNTEIVLRNCFRIIKGDIDFRKKINQILEEYNRKRKQIREDQENVITYNPAQIDKLFDQQIRLKKIIGALQGDARSVQFRKELDEVTAKKQEFQEDYDNVMEMIQQVIESNEALSLQYQDETIDLVQKIAKKDYDVIFNTMSDEDKEDIRLKKFEELESDMIGDDEFDQDILRLEHLSLLAGETSENPLHRFFYLVRDQYDSIKNEETFFSGAAHNTQNVTVELLWNRLPMSAFSYFYNTTSDDMPLRRITGKKRKQLKVINPINELLGKIQTDEDFQAHRDELRDLINKLNIDKDRMLAVNEVLNGPFKRKGANVTQRLKGMLKSIMYESTLPEFESDKTYNSVLANYGIH